MGVSKNKNARTRTGEESRIYKNLRGVDMSAEADAQKRFAYLENMYVDYAAGGDAVESIPGYRRLYSFGERINGLFSQRLGEGEEHLLVHAGTSLYRFPVSRRDSLSEETPIATLKNGKSRAVRHGDDLYVLDGERIILVDKSGEANALCEEIEPYVPTTYIDGKPYEEVNLLSESYLEIYNIGDIKPYVHGSEGIVYSITDKEKRTAAVVGVVPEFEGDLCIPSVAEIDGVLYDVTQIAEKAFAMNNLITSVITNDGMKVIGSHAFYGCEGIERVRLSSTVHTIMGFAFHYCTNLSEFYLGAGISSIGDSSFFGCKSLLEVNYALDEEMLSNVEGAGALGNIPVVYESVDESVIVSLKLATPTLGIDSVKARGERLTTVFKHSTGMLIINVPKKETLERATLEIRGVIDFGLGGIPGFLRESSELGLTPRELILGSTVAESFDGRLFLSGHPMLGATVFYSTKTKKGECPIAYFGSESYFTDGIGGYPVSALLTGHDSLAVFKRSDDGSGTIFHHSRTSGGDKPYPVSHIHRGLHNIGDAVNFLDEALFISSEGLLSIRHPMGSIKRAECESARINKLLSKESSSDVSFAAWCGYLVIHASDRLYLADPRKRFSGSGDEEYDWYTVRGVGSYEGARAVYRYSSISAPGCSVHPDLDKEVTTDVYNVQVPTTVYYYTKINGLKYGVYKTEEMKGGEFSPASAIHAIGELLFFGTESGVLMVFNNDKRGVPPDRIRDALDFDPEEYALAMGEAIHPDFYSFDSHAVRYAAITVRDDCGYPELMKRTVSPSLILKLKSLSPGTVDLSVGDGRTGYSEPVGIALSGTELHSLAFEAWAFGTRGALTVAAKEELPVFLEKEIALSTERFRSPFGVYSIAFRYRIKGRVKQRI